MSGFASKPQILAVILDLDGTLLNTEVATKDVLKDFLGNYGKVLDREKEDTRFGMTQKESAIGVIKDYELPLTPDQFIDEIFPMYKKRWPLAKALPGADRLIRHLHKNEVPFALASNSLSKNIDLKITLQKGWKESFSAVLGSDMVKAGKPAPDIFEEAARRMGVDAAHCLVIEDSLVGVEAAKAAKMSVVAVPSLQNEVHHFSIADSVLHSLLEFKPELWGLKPFDDWINNALPIEPISVTGLYSKGFFSESADGLEALPTQVSGIYFGWAKLDSDEVFKVVTAIGWVRSCCSGFRRKIKLCLIDECNDQINDQQMQLLLVGYIRELISKGNTQVAVEVLDEDKSTASASLDLPEFVHHTVVPFF